MFRIASRLSKTHFSKFVPQVAKDGTFPLARDPDSLADVNLNLDKIEENAYLEYRKYPYVPHQDPKSKEYIESPIDEYHDRTEAQAWNNVIDQFKHDLKLQREIWDAIDKLDRTYKKGVPGVDTNVKGAPKQPKLEDLGFQRRDDVNYGTDTFLNQDSFVQNIPYEINMRPSNIKQWEEQYRNRPATKHFNHAKGYKYDVPIKPEEKYEFIADRLGHPELFGTAVDRLFRLQNDIFHPEYVDQPFVKTPSNKPNADLTFEEGEVIYENTRLLQWLKFWQLSIFSIASYVALFLPYQLVFKTHLTLESADQIGKFFAYHSVSPYAIDTYHVGVPIVGGAACYTVYLLMNLANKVAESYVVKMSYSKDKELVFVKKVDLHGLIQEEVYEAAHLQILPPSIRTGMGDISAVDNDGLTTVTCMNTQKELLLYNEKKYWNPTLRKQFLNSKLNMWDKSYYGYNREEAKQEDKKWNEYFEASLQQRELPK